MTIENFDWSARNDKMPGSEALRVYGKVTVNTSATEATLVRFEGPQPKDLVMRLDLIITQPSGAALQVVTEREVCFTAPGASSFHTVEVRYDGAVLASIPVTETY